MKRGATLAYSTLFLALALPLTPALLRAAEAPALSGDAEMSRQVSTRLSTVIDAMSAGDLEEAATAMQMLRADLQDAMSPYEEFVTLQTSANLNTLLAQHAQAIADYEAILQLPALAESDRLATANMAGQLYLQLQDWNKGLEHLLTVNELQGGTDAETLFRIAFAHAQLGQATAAVPFMEQALAVAGDAAPPDYLRNMALLYIQAQQPARAIAAYDRLFEQHPDIADREQALANVAALAIQVNDRTRAAETLRTLLRDYPNSRQASVWRQSLSAVAGE